MSQAKWRMLRFDGSGSNGMDMVGCTPYELAHPLLRPEGHPATERATLESFRMRSELACLPGHLADFRVRNECAGSIAREDTGGNLRYTDRTRSSSASWILHRFCETSLGCRK